MSTPSQSQPNASQVSNWHIRLRQILDDYFNENDIEALCFDLRFDYERLEGEGKTRKIIELIKEFGRLGRIEELIDYCSRQRPNVPWADLRTAAARDPLAIDSELDEVGAGGSVRRPEKSGVERSRPPSSSRSNVRYVAFGLVGAGLVGLVCLIAAVFVLKPPILFPATPTVPATALPTFIPPASATGSATEFVQQAPYTGGCTNRPAGSVCIRYSDDYVWLVYDSIRGLTDGGLWQGKKIQVAPGSRADYQHVLGTSLVKEVPKK